MSALTLFLIFVAPFVLIGAQAVVAQLSFGGRPVRPASRPVFARMASAGGAWS